MAHFFLKVVATVLSPMLAPLSMDCSGRPGGVINFVKGIWKDKEEDDDGIVRQDINVNKQDDTEQESGVSRPD